MRPFTKSFVTDGLGLLLAALLLLTSSCSPSRGDAASSHLDYAALRAGFSSGVIPADWKVPEYYREPQRFLIPSERTAQSVLGPIWQALTREQKLELLEIVKDQESVGYLGALADIAWYSAPSEADFDVARSMLAALYISTGDVVEVGLVVCEFMAQVIPNARVRIHAQQYVSDLDERRRRLGR